MTAKNFIFIIIFTLSFFIFFRSCWKLFLYMKVGKKKDDRFDNPGKRIINVLKIAFGQSKLLRDPSAGLVHFFIFWGFMLFLFAVIEAIIQGFYSPFSLSFTGMLYSATTFIQDIFSVLVIASCLYALYRRFILHIPRLEVDKTGKLDAAFILVMIILVCVFMLGENISLVARQNFILDEYEVRPVSQYFAGIFYSGSGNANSFYEFFWWAHITVIFGFLNYLPYSKH